MEYITAACGGGVNDEFNIMHVRVEWNVSPPPAAAKG